jgi:hypothetical protein
MTDDPDRDGLSTEEERAIGRSPHRGVIADPVLAGQSTGLELFHSTGTDGSPTPPELTPVNCHLMGDN